MSSEKLTAAIAAIKAGNKAAGLRLLSELVKQEPTNEAAWLWLAVCVVNVEQKRYCLVRVLSINPENAAARKALIQLQSPPAAGKEPVRMTGELTAPQAKVLESKLMTRYWNETAFVENSQDFSSLTELYALLVKMPDPHIIEHIIINGVDESGETRRLTLSFQSLTIPPKK